jgi:hypothetical protein
MDEDSHIKIKYITIEESEWRRLKELIHELEYDLEEMKEFVGCIYKRWDQTNGSDGFNSFELFMRDASAFYSDLIERRKLELR